MSRLKVIHAAAILVIGVASTPIFAKSYANEASFLRGQFINVQVRDGNSSDVFPVFPSGRVAHNYLGGEPGRSYKLELTNTSDRRLMVVVSVDGVNAITGQTASIKQSGYVILPHRTAIIDGWRKSLNDVAKFVFASPSGAYASQTGRPDNVGVIGLAIFEEKIVPLQAPSSANIFGGADSQSSRKSAAEAAPGLGTGHGERIESQAKVTEFTPASSTPGEVIELRYNTLQNLERLGVAIVSKPKPTPFPADSFVPDPPGRVMVR